ncbi:Transposase IS200 like protein [compost metagenome]
MDECDDRKPGHAALRKGRASLANTAYLITTTTVRRTPLFTDFQAACTAALCFESPLLLGDNRMLAWVLMPDHAHWLIQLGERDNLSELVVRLKSASARQANRRLGRQGALWSKAFHDHALRQEEYLRETARYIVANPLRAGLATRVGDYPFWNALWL